MTLTCLEVTLVLNISQLSNRGLKITVVLLLKYSLIDSFDEYEVEFFLSYDHLQVNTYSQDDSDKNSDSEPELFENKLNGEDAFKPQIVSDSDSDIGIDRKKNGNINKIDNGKTKI